MMMKRSRCRDEALLQGNTYFLYTALNMFLHHNLFGVNVTALGFIIDSFIIDYIQCWASY